MTSCLNREVLQQARDALEMALSFIRNGVEFGYIQDSTNHDWRNPMRETRAALDALNTCVARPLDPVLDQHGCIVLHNGREVVYRDEVAFHDPVADWEREGIQADRNDSLAGCYYCNKQTNWPCGSDQEADACNVPPVASGG